MSPVDAAPIVRSGPYRPAIHVASVTVDEGRFLDSFLWLLGVPSSPQESRDQDAAFAQPLAEQAARRGVQP